jgi:hypothetical protein
MENASVVREKIAENSKRIVAQMMHRAAAIDMLNTDV